MARPIEAFRLRTVLDLDNAKYAAGMKASEKSADHLVDHFKKVGPEIDKAFKGKEAGVKFGQSFSASATSLITGSFDALGQTLGGIIGTAIAPGIGTAIGGTIGSAADAAFAKISGPLMQTIAQGIELNKELERTTVEFTTFAGSEKEATKYLKELKEFSIKTGTDFGWVLKTSEELFDLTDNLKLTNTILRAATEQAADFGGEASTIGRIANALGLIAEKGSLASKEMQKLYKVGIDAKKLLAEATGMTEKQIERLMGANRLRGDVAARLISEGILRKKEGFAEKIADTTTYGAESRFNVLTQLRAQEGTQAATKGIGDFYRQGNNMLSSAKAEQFVKFIDQTTGSLINLIENGLSAGVNLAKGLGDGIMSGDAFRAVGNATSKLGNFVDSSLKSVFEIESPSKRVARVVGVPMGEGLGKGMTVRFADYMANEGRDQVLGTLEQLWQDPKIRAFFEAIKRAEGGAPGRIVGGRTTSDLSQHPNVVGMRTSKGPSTAAGSWQITFTNWRRLSRELGLPDFSEHSQALAAMKLFSDRDGGAGMRALLGGDIPGAMRVAAKDWTSTPGSTIGGGGQRSSKQWMGYYNQALNANGAAITDINPMPVRFVADSLGGASAMFGSRRGTSDSLGGAAAMFGNQQTQNLKEYTLVLDDADGAVVDLSVDAANMAQALPPVSQEMLNLFASIDLPLRKLVGAEKGHAQTAIALTKEYQDAAREELIVGMSTLDQLSTAIGQVSGMMPGQQTVGKKRGLFSKILGIAAPFLSFIPGVGPIVSQIAGMASNALGGNWSGVVSGLAGGLASGGVFRSSGGGGSKTTWGNINLKPPGRAAGGPGFRGRTYWTGENGPEPFMAPDNGYFLNHRDAMSAMGGGGSGAGMEPMLERLHGVLARLEGMRPHDVVRMGARGLISAMDQDAGLIRLSAQRHRMA